MDMVLTLMLTVMHLERLVSFLMTMKLEHGLLMWLVVVVLMLGVIDQQENIHRLETKALLLGV